MSVYLLATTLVTTLLIPPAAFEEGGQASGRALAYLAHEYLGDGFGTVYDISSILILWFAGACHGRADQHRPPVSARVRDGPEWGRAVRPVVLVYTAWPWSPPSSSRPTSRPRRAPMPPASSR